MKAMNVGLFVDVGNLYYCIGKKFSGRKLDYEKYMDAAKSEGDSIYVAKAYGVQKAEEAQGFITCLKKIGYMTHFNSIESLKRRVHWDCQIALDVVKYIDKLDVVVLGTANPDFVPLVDWVKNQGRQCIVRAAGIHKELKAATRFDEIMENLLEEEKKNA